MFDIVSNSVPTDAESKMIRLMIEQK